MNRQETISLLKEIIAICGSFYNAQAVSIVHDKVSNTWELHAYCTPLSSEIDCLKQIVTKNGLEMIISNDMTIFRSIVKTYFFLWGGFKISFSWVAGVSINAKSAIYQWFVRFCNVFSAVRAFNQNAAQSNLSTYDLNYYKLLLAQYDITNKITEGRTI